MKLSLVLLLALCLIGAALSFEDNEFADFEFDGDDDDNEVETAPKIESNKNKAKESKGNENFMEVDDSDDGVVEDEFDHFSDNDEFEGFGGSDAADNRDLPDIKKTDKLEPLTMAKVPLHGLQWDSYWIEMLFIAGLLVYFVNYAMGKNKNIKIANAWLNSHRTFLEDNFALVGDDGKKETDLTETGMMVKESDSLFTLWCSGRICCEGMLVELKLIKRQDLLALAMGILSSKTQDQVVVKAEISKDSMDTFVFALCTKKTASKMMKDMSDLVSNLRVNELSYRTTSRFLSETILRVGEGG